MFYRRPHILQTKTNTSVCAATSGAAFSACGDPLGFEREARGAEAIEREQVREVGTPSDDVQKITEVRAREMAGGGARLRLGIGVGDDGDFR